jgi:ATP-dependent Clp protease ATP-binding subunit ClpA
MIAQELEVSLHQAFVQARAKRHEFISVEHLLLALVHNPTAADVLRACGTAMDALRNDLSQHIAQHTPVIAADRQLDTQPTLGFQRVIQGAILHVQSAGKKEVTGADVLVAIFGEKNSHAVRLLQQHGVTRREVMNYISHGITKAPPANHGKPDQDGLASSSTVEEMPGDGVIAEELKLSLDRALADARQKRHEFVTVEHLLLALLENPVAAEVLHACGANMDVLRSALTEHIIGQTPVIAPDREVDTQQTLGFQRVLQRAILHVLSSKKKEVASTNVLVAMFGEKDSHAVYFLQQQGVTRLNVVTYVSHRVVPESAKPAQIESDSSEVQVVLYNDEYTPMEFLARVLQEFFAMSKEDAAEAMLEIYRDGKAVCGLYSREDGKMLVQQVLAYAAENGHPLACTTVAPK